MIARNGSRAREPDDGRGVTTGTHDSKPAHWVDANIHAIEITGYMVLPLVAELVGATL